MLVVEGTEFIEDGVAGTLELLGGVAPSRSACSLMSAGLGWLVKVSYRGVPPQ
ncbi:hypothetical protein [Nonomuraea sp. NPDC050786]|uniref:hypothetical protein n=1 Tax=Nonomuraea sp. NPDC050786 TaxID=3154840 RepID=UPI0033D9AC2D